MSAILPGATLGVIGGGQLGRMFVQAALRMGYFTAVLDPDAEQPRGAGGHHHVRTDYSTSDGLGGSRALRDAITTEFENVPAPVRPPSGARRGVAVAATAVSIARIAPREGPFLGCDVPCAPYAVIESSEADLARCREPAARHPEDRALGYDGKGQLRVARATNCAPPGALKRVPCVLEKLLPLAFECW